MSAEGWELTGPFMHEVDPDDVAAPPEPARPKHLGMPRTEELLVPGGHTEAFWYAAAMGCRPAMESTRGRGWVDGFVAGLEAARGIDGDPILAAMLRDSINLEIVLPQ